VTGSVVGDGECTALATGALRRAGAHVPRGGSYEWGVRLPSAASAERGDLLQFTRFHVVVQDAHGAGTTSTRGHPFHTAIVLHVISPGVYEVAEQNMIHGRHHDRGLATDTIYVTSGSTSDHRTVTVTGGVVAYRAAAR
jgi:hypothetical protein